MIVQETSYIKRLDIVLGVARPIASSLHQAKTGARRAPLKMGVEVPVLGRRIHIHVSSHKHPPSRRVLNQGY